jgi:hypothetical protein
VWLIFTNKNKSFNKEKDFGTLFKRFVRIKEKKQGKTYSSNKKNNKELKKRNDGVCTYE